MEPSSETLVRVIIAVAGILVEVMVLELQTIFEKERKRAKALLCAITAIIVLMVVTIVVVTSS